MHSAVRAGYRLDECRRMTIRQLIAVAELEAERERADFLSAASAARLSQADKRGWKKFTDDLSKEPSRQTIAHTRGEEIDPESIRDNPLFRIPDEEE